MDPRSSREHQRETIDAEIHSLELTIQELKLRRNGLAPISSLPAELMAAIFSHLRLPPNTPPTSSLTSHIVAELFHSGTLSTGSRPGHCPTDLLCATHVCHQWREIVLNDPLFWNHVDFTNLTSAGAAEILARAKEMPLHLEASDARHVWEDDARRGAFEKVLQSRSSRICHLRIRAENFRLHRIFDGLTSPAPILEHLSLSQGYPWVPISVPDTLFNGTAPRLSRLELRNVNISWNSPFLKGLRFLEIRVPSKGARPSLKVWLDALDEMPSLESLVLHSASPIAPPFPFDIERAVNLPSLMHLDIAASAGDCALALAHLTLPALTKLCLTAEYYRLEGGEVQNLIPCVAQHAGGPQPLQSAFIQHRGTVTAVLAWPVPNIDIKVNMDDPSAFLSTALSARVALFLTSNTPTPSRHRHHLLSTTILNTLMMALPLDSLVSLTVQHYTRLDAQFWLRHAPKWPLLQHVQLTPPEARGFRKLLLQGNGSRPLLPSLTKLVLIDVALSEHRTLHLCDALMARVEQGVPLETLDLRSCKATRDAVDLLREIVVDVLEPITITRVFPSLGNPSRGLFVLNDSSGEDDYSDDDDIEEGQESEDYSDMGED
jgi:hypothetical protein